VAVLAGADVPAAGVLTDGDGAAADVEELPEEEHPATVASTPATAASTTTDGRTLRTATDDTVIPTSDLEPDPVNVPAPCTAQPYRPCFAAQRRLEYGGVRETGAVRNNVAGTPAFGYRAPG
jgi:hypothetical protein